MNQKFMKSVLVVGLIALSMQANAAGFNKFNNKDNGKVLSSTQFYQVLATTKSDQFATKFGFPDQMKTLKNAAGETEGVVWVYRDAVHKADGMQDASFVIINGEMKYVTLSKAV
jgi:hypothetical protein